MVLFRSEVPSVGMVMPKPRASRCRKYSKWLVTVPSASVSSLTPSIRTSPARTHGAQFSCACPILRTHMHRLIHTECLDEGSQALLCILLREAMKG